VISKHDIQAFGEKHRILLQGDEFIYILPHHALRTHIADYTITFPTKDFMSDRTTILSYGSATLVIESTAKKLSIKLFGPSVKPCLIGNTPSEMIVTIDFRPAGLYALTGISQSELTDKAFPFEEINFSLSKLLSEAIEKATSVSRLVTNLDILLLESMSTIYPPQLNLVFQNVFNSAGNIAVKKLSDDIHYSERHLNRMFKQYVGTGVKTFTRLIRMNVACHLLQNCKNSVEIVSELTGFQDPSHFVRDFELICGITPKTYRDNMSDFHNEIAMSLMYIEDILKYTQQRRAKK